MKSRRDFLRMSASMVTGAYLLGSTRAAHAEEQAVYLPMIRDDIHNTANQSGQIVEEVAQEAVSDAAQADLTLVIGAGMAGLAAARDLVKRGRKVLVLEGRNRIGGRIYSDRSWPNSALDLGASWIHGVKGNPITTLANEFKLTRLPTNPESGAEYNSDGSGVSDAQWSQIEGNFEAVMEQVDTIRAAREANDLPDLSLKTILDQILAARQDSAQMKRSLLWCITSEIENEYASDVSDLSLYNWDADSFNPPGGDVLFPQGFDQVISGLAKGLDIRLGQIVQKIAYGALGVTVTTNQGTFQGSRVIISLPLGVLKRGTINFTPALPADKLTAINRLNMGVLNKAYFRFPRVFWDQSVDWISYMGERKGEWALWLNLYKYTKQPVLLGFNAGSYGTQIEAMSDPAIVDSAMQTLRTLYGPNIPNPEASLITRWGQDPFAYGSYSHVPPAATSDDRSKLAKPVGKQLYFAGEATHRQYPSTVHGAYLSGIRAVQQIVG